VEHKNSFDLDTFRVIATNIHRLSMIMGRITDGALQNRYGFGLSQYKILWALYTHTEGVRQSDIAAWLNLTEAAVSRQMKNMGEQELIESHVDDQNRRSHIVCLTEKGRQFAAEAMKTLGQAYEQHFAVLSASEQAQLADLLQRLFGAVVKADTRA
jgi:DNA-binding MarR family transcriptional regulator